MDENKPTDSKLSLSCRRAHWHSYHARDRALTLRCAIRLNIFISKCIKFALWSSTWIEHMKSVTLYAPPRCLTLTNLKSLNQWVSISCNKVNLRGLLWSNLTSTRSWYNKSTQEHYFYFLIATSFRLSSRWSEDEDVFLALIFLSCTLTCTVVFIHLFFHQM